MTAAFAERAARLAGIAAVLAGWSPDIFWRATPAELEAVLIALAGAEGATTPPRADLIASLQERYPDG